MAIQDKTTTKTGATNIKNETTPNANTATRVGTQFENQVDSAMYILEDSPTAAFVTDLTFDDQRGKFMAETLSGDFTFTLAASGNIAGASIVIALGPDSSSTVEFSNAFLDVNDNNFQDFDNTKLNKIFMYYDAGGRVFVNIRPIEIDLVAPTITGGSIPASNNSYIDVSFDKGIYGDILALEPVEISDFNITFLQNAGTATAWTPTTITKISGGALIGGETLVRINGTLTGVADGNETLEVKPADATSIYSRFAVAMADTETTGVINLNSAYAFANTHELVIDTSGEGIKIIAPDCYPSDGAGNDEAFSVEFWYKIPAPLPSSGNPLIGRDDGAASIFYMRRLVAGGHIDFTLLTNGSNLLRRTGNTVLLEDTFYHFIITYDGSKTVAGIKIYIDGTEESGYTDDSTGTYTGMASLVGTFFLDVGNFTGTQCDGNYQIFRQFNENLTGVEVTTLYNTGTPVGLTSLLQAKCVQENLFNNSPNADNIGVDGTNEGTVTYQLI